jgi:hypothetical protein
MNIIDNLKRAFRFGSKQKVFCIGYNKTGTTTVEQVLSDLGYRMPNQAKQESLTVEEMFKGNYKPLISLCKKYDAFQDMPFSQSVTYAILDALFPGSKFILNVRDSDEWFESLTRFHLKGVMNSGGIDKLDDFSESTYKDKNVYLHKNYMYNITKRHAVKVEDNKVEYDWSLVYNKDYRTDRYERRNREIISFFRERPEQLLVIDITKEKDNSKIVKFLGLPEKYISDLPHLNSSK